MDTLLLQIQLFGTFQVKVQGEALPRMRSKMERRLLMLLALKAAKPVAREWLAQTLWPDSEPTLALYNLRRSLVNLRQALGPAAPRLSAPSPQTLCLDLGAEELDLLAFDAALAADSPAGREKAVAVYAGPFLQECSEEWAFLERVRYEQAYLGALERLASEAQEHHPALAVRNLRLLIASDPLREGAHAALMQALADCGDYSAVTQVYRDLRLLLHRELNAAPAAETEALYRRLKQQALCAAPAVAPLPQKHHAAAPLPPGPLTFLFTDIEGSTRLWEEHLEAMDRALARHDALLYRTIKQCHGQVFRTVGDAFCAVFTSPPDALAAAIAIHLCLQAEPWGETGPIRVRIGLHTGEAQQRDGDFFGPTLNRVARLQSLGYGEQTLLSEATYTQVKNQTPQGVALEAMGSHWLKDLSKPELVWQILHPALPSQFPPLKSLRFFPNNLPQQFSSFIGREKEIGAVQSLLGSHRLLTLTGSGGSGKTRLALEVGAALLEEYPDGIWLVELAALTDPALIAAALLQTLGLREEGDTPLLRTLTDYLKPRKLLLLLDNCEHLLSACAHLADHLLKSAPEVRILASSREALGVAGEQAYRIPPLRLPDLKRPTIESLIRSEAARLFVERALLAQPAFTLTAQNAATVAELCHQLDGIPLALELAAARLRSLPVEEIRTRLDQRFRLLTAGNRTALPRQQTLRALIDWSYDLLTEGEKRLLRRLSVFAGGWTLSAAESVCSGEGIEDWEVVDLLSSLVDKSLVVAEVREGGGRYRLLETVRHYAIEKRSDLAGESETPGKHCDWFLALCEGADVGRRGQQVREWLERLESERANLNAALTWSLTEAKSAETRLRLCIAMAGFWGMQGYLQEGRAWCDAALNQPGSEARTALRAKVLNVAGSLATGQGDYAAARTYHEETLAIAREIGAKQGAASALGYLGNVAERQGDFTAAGSYYTQCLTAYEELGNQQGIAAALNGLGLITYYLDDLDGARTYYEKSLTIEREIQNPMGIAGSLINLGNLFRKQGDLVAAKAFFEQSLSIFRELGYRQGLAVSLGSLGQIAYIQEDYLPARTYFAESLSLSRDAGDQQDIATSLEAFGGLALATYAAKQSSADAATVQALHLRAARLWGAAEALRERIGAALPPSTLQTQAQEVAEGRERIGSSLWMAAWAEGRTMDLEQAIAYALEGDPDA